MTGAPEDRVHRAVRDAGQARGRVEGAGVHTGAPGLQQGGQGRAGRRPGGAAGVRESSRANAVEGRVIGSNVSACSCTCSPLQQSHVEDEGKSRRVKRYYCGD